MQKDSFEFSNYLEGCKIAFSESGVLFMILIVRNCALIFLPQQIVLLSSRFLYLRRRSNPSSFLLLGPNVFSPQNFPVFSGFLTDCFFFYKKKWQETMKMTIQLRPQLYKMKNMCYVTSSNFNLVWNMLAQWVDN